MTPRKRIGGNCGLCDAKRMQLPNGVWVCPHYWHSPMHGCGDHQEYDKEGINVIKSFEEVGREDLESYAKCSVEEYIEARDKYFMRIRNEPMC